MILLLNLVYSVTHSASLARDHLALNANNVHQATHDGMETVKQTVRVLITLLTQPMSIMPALTHVYLAMTSITQLTLSLVFLSPIQSNFRIIIIST